MPDLRSLPRTRYWGHPDVVPTPYQVRGNLQSGTISKTGSRFSPGTLDSGPRIRSGAGPAGMTPFLETVSLWTDTK